MENYKTATMESTTIKLEISIPNNIIIMRTWHKKHTMHKTKVELTKEDIMKKLRLFIKRKMGKTLHSASIEDKKSDYDFDLIIETKTFQAMQRAHNDISKMFGKENINIRG